MIEHPTISVIIPTLDNPDALGEVITKLNEQTLLPSEIIVSDSSSGNEIENLITEANTKIKTVYLRQGRAFKFDRFIIKFKSLLFGKRSLHLEKKGRTYPYEATNLGAHEAKSEWLAFLDTTTMPSDVWLENYFGLLEDQESQVVFGVTKYLAQSKFQKLLRASTYGMRGHETVPGTLIRKKDFINSGEILKGVRSGGDIEWRNRIKSDYKWVTPNDFCLTYSYLPTDLFTAAKKFFIYQLHGARLNIQNKVKDTYLAILLILSAIVIPQWNGIVGWEESPLYLPYVTRIYAISLVIIFLSTLFINKGILRNIPNSTSFNIIKMLIFMFVFIAVFRWNEVVANWVEESVWYIPNITKIYVGIVLLSSIVYRGLYFPLTNKVEKTYLFPFKWIVVGMLGLFLDAVKAPGYVIGSIISPFTKKIN